MVNCCFFSRSSLTEEEQLIKENYKNKSLEYIKMSIKKNKLKESKECCMGFVYTSSSLTSAIATCASGGTTSAGTIPATAVCGAAALNSISNYFYYKNKKEILKKVLKKLLKNEYFHNKSIELV